MSQVRISSRVFLPRFCTGPPIVSPICPIDRIFYRFRSLSLYRFPHQNLYRSFLLSVPGTVPLPLQQVAPQLFAYDSVHQTVPLLVPLSECRLRLLLVFSEDFVLMGASTLSGHFKECVIVFASVFRIQRDSLV